ncbi:hypothetical protein ACWDSJ_26400 [Nocardia sp. NPDC003482]
MESTAGIMRAILEPGCRPSEIEPDFSNLIILTAQTGDEWRSTCDLVARHVLPVLRALEIRTVEVARAGPSRRDGIVILQDTRHPERMHPDPEESGFYALITEHRHNAVMPILASRTCSAKAKGWPLDTWRERHLAAQPYFHAIGYNLDEQHRIDRDRAITLGGQRTPVYPLYTDGWTRQRCQQYLFDLLGVWWPKSCCRQCPFVSVPSWPEQLARYRAAPEEAFGHLVDEYLALAVNRNSTLFGRTGTLADRLRAGDAIDVLTLAEQHMASCDWAVYRVRRLYHAKATAVRSLEIVTRGPRDQQQQLLRRLAGELSLAVSSDEHHERLWLAQRAPGQTTYPQLEQFYVAAPAAARPKLGPNFEQRWASHSSDELRDLDMAAADSLAALEAFSAPCAPARESGFLTES